MFAMTNKKFISLALITASLNASAAKKISGGVADALGVLSSAARELPLEMMKANGEKIDIPKIDYGKDTFYKLSQVHSDLKNRDRSTVKMNKAFSAVVDHVAIPLVDVAAIALAPETMGASIAVGYLVSTPLAMASQESRAQITRFEEQSKALISSATRDFLFAPEGSQYLSDLLEINKISEPSLRKHKMEEYMRSVRGVMGEIYEQADEDGEVDGKDQFNNLITDFLTQEVLNNRNLINANSDQLKTHLEKIGKNALGIENNRAELAKLSNALETYKSQTMGALTYIHNYQKAFSKAMSFSLDKIDGKVSTLLQIEFSKMSPAEKINAVKEGGLLYAHLNEEQRSAIISKFEDVTKLTEFGENTRKVLKGIQLLSEIGTKLGLHKSLIKPINEAAKIIGPATDIIMGMYSPNPIQFMSGLSSALGGGKIDAAQARHEQLVAMLESLLEGQIKILKNQAQMKEKLEQLQNAQVEIYNKLISIEDKLSQIDLKLNTLIDETLYNRELIIQILRDKFTGCSNILDALEEKYIESMSDTKHLLIYELEDVLFEEKDKLDSCLSAYENNFRVFNDNGMLKALLGVKSYQRKYYEIEETNLYRPMLRLHKELSRSHYYFDRLSIPSSNFKALNEINKAFDKEDSRLGKRLKNHLNNQISINTLSDFVYKFKEIYPYLELSAYVNKRDNIAVVSDIKNIFKRLSYVSMIPVAQENILSGAEIVDALYANRAEEGQTMREKLLQQNSNFYKNYISYFTQEKLKEKKVKVSDFQMDIIFKKKEQVKEIYNDIGYGFKLIHSPYVSRVSELQVQMSGFINSLRESKKHVNTLIQNHDSELLGELGSLTVSEVNAFYDKLISKIEETSTKIEAVKSDSSKVESVISFIETNDFNKEMKNFYSSPFELKTKYNSYKIIMNDLDTFRELTKEVSSSIKRRQEFWIKGSNGKVYLLPDFNELLEGKVYRSQNFDRAYSMYTEIKTDYTNYNLEFEILRGEDKNLKKYLFEAAVR